MRRQSGSGRADGDTAMEGALGPWLVALLLAGASFLVLFDSLAVATALPSIGVEFGLRPGVLQWVVSLYSISIGAFLVLGGRVCDLWGRRRVLVASLALCAFAGLAAGLAPNLPVLLAGRVLQGVAAAFALPAALATAATVFPREPWKSRVFSVIALAAWTAGLAGAMLGGLITSTLGWEWVFLVTAPVGAVAVVLAVVLLPPDAPRRGTSERLDVWGALLASTGLVTLILGLEQVGKGEHTSRALLITCCGLALLAGLAVVERRVAHPLVNPRLLRSRKLVGACLAFGAYCAGYTALVVVGSLHLQEVHHLSAAEAGLVLSPVLIGGVVSSSLAGTLLRRFTTRLVVTCALVLCASALAVIALRGDGSVGSLLPWLAAWGLFSGPIYVGLTRSCIGDAPEEDRGTVSALFESMSHVGGAIAIAVYMTMLGAGFDYEPTELLGVAVVAVGAVAAFTVLPSRRADPATRPSADSRPGD